jgi:PAS domain S-box-containing protein
MADAQGQATGDRVEVAWRLPADPELTDAIEDAGFYLGDEAPAVVVCSDANPMDTSGPFGPRWIVIIGADESPDHALEAGAFRVLCKPVPPETLVLQIQRASTDWHRARRLVLQEAILGRVHDLAFVTDGAGRLSYINRGATRLLGVVPSEVLGHAIDDLLPGGGSAAEREQVQYQIEHDTEERWIQGAWQVVRDPAGQPIARLLVARDVTRELALRQDLVRSGALAELGMMAAEVAHEVNNPATYLMTNLSILRDDLSAGSLDEIQAAELVEECLDGVTRITEIVRRMRILASGHSEESMDTLMDLAWVVRDACRIAGLRVKYKADLHIHDSILPQVKGSSKRIGQVVLNLVVNAADALSGQIDPMPRIDVSLGQDDAFAWVDVRDNGPGVPDSMRERMFEAFVTSKSEEGGTGLGLAVSSTIADEHGGRLELRNHDGGGAWFRLQLPLPSE